MEVKNMMELMLVEILNDSLNQKMIKNFKKTSKKKQVKEKQKMEVKIMIHLEIEDRINNILWKKEKIKGQKSKSTKKLNMISIL